MNNIPRKKKTITTMKKKIQINNHILTQIVYNENILHIFIFVLYSGYPNNKIARITLYTMLCV